MFYFARVFVFVYVCVCVCVYTQRSWYSDAWCVKIGVVASTPAVPRAVAMRNTGFAGGVKCVRAAFCARVWRDE